MQKAAESGKRGWEFGVGGWVGLGGEGGGGVGWGLGGHITGLIARVITRIYYNHHSMVQGTACSWWTSLESSQPKRISLPSVKACTLRCIIIIIVMIICQRCINAVTGSYRVRMFDAMRVRLRLSVLTFLSDRLLTPELDTKHSVYYQS